MRFIAPAATVVALLAACACAPAGEADPNLASPAASKSGSPKSKSDMRTVTYKISGDTDAADVTYATASGQEQQQGAKLPWTKTFKVRRNTFSVLVLSAQNQGSGAVRCEITVDGKTVKRAQSSGQFAIVSCDHSLGF